MSIESEETLLNDYGHIFEEFVSEELKFDVAYTHGIYNEQMTTASGGIRYRIATYIATTTGDIILVSVDYLDKNVCGYEINPTIY